MGYIATDQYGPSSAQGGRRTLVQAKWRWMIILAVSALPFGAHFALAGPSDGSKKPDRSLSSLIVDGDKGIAPHIAFSKGDRAYLEFSNLAEVPAIFVEKPSGRELVIYDVEKPYVVVPKPTSPLVLVLNDRKATIAPHSIPTRAVEASVVAPAAASAPAQSSPNQPAPNLLSPNQAAPLFPIQADAAKFPTGVPTQIKPPSQPLLDTAGPAAVTEWPVTKGATFRETLTDWATRAKWDVRYEAGVPNPRLLGSHTFKGTLDNAVSDLVVAIRFDSQYRITLHEGNKLMHVHAR